MSNLDDKLTELARLRQAIAELETQRDFADDALRETNEFARLEEANFALKSANDVKKHLEEEIKLDAVQAYKSHELELPPDGITLKNFKVLKVADDKKAKAWLASNAPALLSYSDSKLLKAVENLEIDWATVETEPRAQIASDLSVYLEDKNENSNQ